MSLTKADLTNKRKSALLFANISPDGSVAMNEEAKRACDGDAQLEAYVQSVLATVPTQDNPEKV